MSLACPDMLHHNSIVPNVTLKHGMSMGDDKLFRVETAENR